MITVSRSIKLSNVALPVDYSFTLPDSCVNIVSTSITDNIIDVVFTFSDSTCITYNSVIKLNLTDANGCKKTFNLTVPNPCADFSTTGVESGSQFSFRVPISGGDGPFVYEWLFDTELFELDREIGNFIFLTPIGDFIAGQTTNISVTVTDSNGCVLESDLDYSICGPEFDLDPFSTSCITGDIRSTGRIYLDITSCGAAIDWSTLIITVPNGVTVINQGGGYFIINFREEFPDGVYTFPITVETIDGVLGSGEITIDVVDCLRSPDVVTYEFNFECDACDNIETEEYQGIEVPNRQLEDNPQCFGPILVHIPDLIVDGNINWDSFTFIQGPGQILVDPFEIFTQFGHAIFTANQDVIYEPNVDLTLDVITYSVEDTNGEVLQGTLIFTKDFCGDAPVAIDDDLCVACGETLGPINLLANDLGDIDPSSFEFLGPFPLPSQGVLTIFPNGVIQFVPNVGFDGEITFQYTVDNLDGVTSNVATVTIEVNCVEQTEFEESYCVGDALVDLWQLIGIADTGSSWEFVGFSATQGGTLTGQTFAVNQQAPQFYLPGASITTSYEALVDLTNSPEGFYYFTYTGGECMPDVTVTIETVDQENLEDVQLEFCITDVAINLDTLFPNLPDGTWNFDGDGFVDPVFTFPGTGIYEFYFVADNEGEFGEICSNSFNLTVVVEAIGFNPGVKEITVCTNGTPPS